MREAGPNTDHQASAPKVRVRLGRNFAKLWLAQGVSNLGDGLYLTALPLLAATLTRDPFTVSAVMFAEWLPWLLGTQMVTQELAGPPAGGFLFSVRTGFRSPSMRSRLASARR